MKYYFSIIDNKIISTGQCKVINALNIEVSKEVFENSEKYIYQDGAIVLNPNYEAEKQAQEQERIAMLSLTAADVERGIYKATGKDFEDVVAMVTELQPVGLDIKALKIELKANNFYRGNAYVDSIGTLLGFSKEQLDMFFETGDYIYLLPLIPEEEIPF